MTVLMSVSPLAGCGRDETPAPSVSSEPAPRASAREGQAPAAGLEAGAQAGRANRDSGATPAAPPAADAVASHDSTQPDSAVMADSPKAEASESADPRERKRRNVLADAERTLAAPRFDEFRQAALPYLEIVKEMRPLDVKFAGDGLSESEREIYWKLDAKKNKAFAHLHEIMFRPEFDGEDRRAMGQWLAIAPTK
jgi:hypothetical protein